MFLYVSGYRCSKEACIFTQRELHSHEKGLNAYTGLIRDSPSGSATHQKRFICFYMYPYINIAHRWPKSNMPDVRPQYNTFKYTYSISRFTYTHTNALTHIYIRV